MAADDITINFGAGFTSSYVLEQNPWPFVATRLRFYDRYRTSAGRAISYFRALKWRFEMSFTNISLAMYDNLQTIANTPETYQLVLPPNTVTGARPNGTFVVNWMNNYEFSYLAPFWSATWKGKIIFEEV